MKTWISFFDKLPEDGQKIWYYGEWIGVWLGEYSYTPNDPYSPHIIYCSTVYGFVDRMDAPWYMVYEENDERPQRPQNPYPPDYPHATA